MRPPEPTPLRPAGPAFTPSDIPTEPGVYLLKDAEGGVLYVGKARNLRRRLAAYLKTSGRADPKARALASRVAAVETVLTRTEKEALILESTLIKRHRPRYNVVLKDDKRYPSLRLDPAEKYPALHHRAQDRRGPRALLRAFRLGPRRARDPRHHHQNLQTAQVQGERVPHPHTPLPALPDERVPGALLPRGGHHGLPGAGSGSRAVFERAHR
jgi:predicted GIY-YIG superfamily endonuclease